MLRILTLAVLFACASFASAEPDAIDSALSMAGRGRADFRVYPEVLLGPNAGRLALPVFERWFTRPPAIPTYERHLRFSLMEANGVLRKIWSVAASTIGMGTQRDLIPPKPHQKYAERAAKPRALETAIRALDSTAVIPDLSDVSPVMQQAAAMVLFALADAVQWRKMALRNIPGEDLPGLYEALCEPVEWPARDSLIAPKRNFPGEYEQFHWMTDLLESVDYPLISAATDDLASVLDSLRTLFLHTPPAGKCLFQCHTRWGEIIISHGRNDKYEDGKHYLLILDTSGDDLYRTGGTSGGADLPFGVIFDFRGDDRYETSRRAPCFGAGILGIGAVVDAAGNDSYRSPWFYSQGAGVAGCGLLLDCEGNDSYSAIGGAQGFGFFGIGILTDLDGDDAFRCYHSSQGCGMTHAMGLLMDGNGNDVYEANDNDIQFPSSQTKAHNTSLAQGAGVGVRRDYLDGRSLAGGVGMLLDLGGDDRYSGGVFCQAVGYWYGIGILDDRMGNDNYRSVWYGQSATAHMAVSILCDGGGDDAYTSLMTMGGGAAHDFSVSIFLEEDGNDSYAMTANCLGRSLSNSAALFVDIAGNDSYRGKDGLGTSQNPATKGPRLDLPTLSLFLDLRGSDAYPDSARDRTGWLQPPSGTTAVLIGVGLDGESLTVRWDGLAGP